MSRPSGRPISTVDGGTSFSDSTVTTATKSDWRTHSLTVVLERAPPVRVPNSTSSTRRGRSSLVDADPLVQLAQAQRFAVALAESRGLQPDTPRHLTRSVVLS